MHKDYERTSVVAPYIEGLLAEKRALGYSYVFEEYLLNVFYDQMLPYLSKYLGHSCIEDSLYYYHLNEEANRLIRKNDQSAGRVVPGVEKYGA